MSRSRQLDHLLTWLREKVRVRRKFWSVPPVIFGDFNNSETRDDATAALLTQLLFGRRRGTVRVTLRNLHHHSQLTLGNIPHFKASVLLLIFAFVRARNRGPEFWWGPKPGLSPQL